MNIELFRSLPDKGFKLFPVIPGGKTPAVEGWQDRATSSWDRLGWLLKGKYNAGIFTGRFQDGEALLVIDCDRKGTKNGEAFLAVAFDPLPDTFTVRTPSGGKHLYFRTTKKFPNSVEALGPGVDIRSQGGYVVAPGSSTPDGEYTIVSDAPVAYAPQWLEDLIPPPHTPSSRQALVELDRPEYIAGAIEYLDRLAKPAIEGQGGDLQTFKTACHVKDIGISEYSAMTLMEEHYNPRCVPPWEYEALAVKVNSAYRNGQNPPGAHAGATTDDFQAVAPAPPSSSERTPNPFPSIAFGDCKVDLTRIDLIEDWLPQGGMTVIYGNSHVGKTFVFCDMAFHIAAGWDWMGKRTLQKPVAIVATEGGNGIQNRMAALQIKYGARLAAEGRTVADIPFLIVPAVVDLRTNLDDALRVVDTIRAFENSVRAKLGLLGIDTLARAMAGGDENGPADMGAYITTIDLLRKSTEANVASVHHCGKDADKGARGHSSLRAATDTEIEVRNNTIYSEKQRDMEPTDPIGFTLEKILLGKNAYGKDVTSCVLAPATASEKKISDRKQGLKPREKDLLCAFDGAIDLVKKDDRNFISDEEWRLNLKNMLKMTSENNANWSLDANRWNEQFRRAKTQLVDARCVLEMQTNQWFRIA